MFRVVALIVSIFATLSVARKSCRQCFGSLEIHFGDYTTLDNVQTYVAGTFGMCATGRQYGMTSYTFDECITKNNAQACKTWNLKYDAWRYCGNGGKVDYKRIGFCSGDVCADEDRLYMKCVKSVECVGDCKCSQCGC